MIEIKKDLEKLKHCNILLVDDDPKQIELISVTLSHFFKTIFTATNGAEALEIFQEKRVDIIFTDYVMPMIDGWTFCNEIRQINRNLPIVMLSNYSDKEKLLGVIPLKITTYLLKPISLTNIIETLQMVLNEMISTRQLSFQINETTHYCYFNKSLSIDGVITPLVKIEILLLELFINNANSLVTNETIENLIAQETLPTYKAVANTIYRLRKKIGKESLVNVQSIGYILRTI